MKRAPDPGDERQVLGQYIPLQYHYNMLADAARMSGFKEALSRVVPLGGRVLDLGGGTGVLSFFAAQRAVKVWCVEQNPELVGVARRILATNAGGDKIEVIAANAFDYLPPEPVDVVICEMLHVGLLREKQVAVIESFKRRYAAKFGPKLPMFVPEASFQAFQLVEHSFDMHGFYAPVLFFQQPSAQHADTRPLGAPTVYQCVRYESDLPSDCAWRGSVTVEEAGTLNAIRFVTKNVLAVLPEERRTVDWWNQYLVLPLTGPFHVSPGDVLSIAFSYRPGASIDELSESLQVSPAAG